MRRHSIKPHRSRALFSKTAGRMRRENIFPPIMRGGTRL